MWDEYTILPRKGFTIREARRTLAGLHFAQESLTTGERTILHLAEGLLNLIDEDRAPLADITDAVTGIVADGLRVDVFVYDDKLVAAWDAAEDGYRTLTRGRYGYTEVVDLFTANPNVTVVDARSTLTHHTTPQP